jgi:ribonucleoside-diphosphate reductase alpha chain
MSIEITNPVKLTDNNTQLKNDKPIKKSFFNDNDMYVTKRNGKTEAVSFDKILKRIKHIGQNLNIKINYTTLAMKVIDQLYDKISTTKIDELSAEQCASMVSIHPDYYSLASQIIISNHHKNTPSTFSKAMSMLYKYKDKHGKHYPLLADDVYDIIQKNATMFDNLCNDCSRDFLIDYFGFKTLERSYLMRVNQKIVERPQYMWLRVAIGIHKNNIEKAIETYNLMSQKYFTHATPTLFNSGTPHSQNSSCYLIAMENDSIEGIYNTLKDCALISKWAGGIGIHIHNVRAQGSHIRGTNGTSNGIIPMLKVFNNTAKYVDQCVHPETIIYTTTGAKQIQHCVSNETSIYNINGEVEVIENVLEHHYTGELYKIYSSHSIYPLSVTPEHPVYILRNDIHSTTPTTYKNIDENKDFETHSNFEWVDVKDLNENDMLVYPIPKYSQDISNISPDDCYVYGLILRNCSITNNKSFGSIYLNTINHFYIIEFLVRYFEEKLVKYNIIEKDNGLNVIIDWDRCIHLPFRYNDFFNDQKEKHINHKWLNLPIEKSKYILKGFLYKNVIEGSEITFSNNSIHIIEACRFICLKMGILTSGYVEKLNDIPQYYLTIPTTEEFCLLNSIKYNNDYKPKYINCGEYLLTRIQQIEHSNYDGILYDLQMKKEHNYLLHNGLVHNGGGRRNGSIAVYLETWHADIELFLEMRKNHGDEEMKARDLFYALWISDLFMERVKSGGKWTLMCPDECQGLSDVYGEQFVKLYEKYENEGKGRKTMNARDLWFQILDAQMETGNPYLVYKDAANKKSNQQNVGTIKSSNLCVAPETLVLTDKGHIEIQKLEGKTVNVWNGEEFSEVTVFKTGENQELIDIETNDGCMLTCTKYHKFFIETKIEDNDDEDTTETKPKTKIDVIEAQNLKIGDTLIQCKFPIINNQEYEEDYIPSKNIIEEKVSWFSDYCDRSNTVFENNTIVITSIHQLLIKIKLMLQTCGINPIIIRYDNVHNLNICKLFVSKKEIRQLILLGFNPKLFNLDEIKKEMKLKKGEETETEAETEAETEMEKVEAETEMEKVEAETEMEETEKMKGEDNIITTDVYDEEFVKLNNIPNIVNIKKIYNRGRRDNTFCFTEPKRNSAIFNGIITSQCSEIIEYSDHNETAVCNLASVALPSFVEKEQNEDGNETTIFNYKKLHDIVRVMTYNLNQIIDINFYPTEKTKRSNLRHRPIGIGIQGLADVFMMMNLPFTSDAAKNINSRIFETIYHSALVESCELSKIHGPYETFVGSPASLGKLQFDLWGITQSNNIYDWDKLKKDIQTFGIRNSLLLAPMPTASTSQILGYNECFEPITSNIYSRRTIAGEFIVANKYLMNDLIKLDLWNEKIKNNIIANNGSVQQIEIIPEYIREKYKTVWEIPMRNLIDMAADRGIFICQSQSLNLWLEDPTYNSLTSMHFYAWSKGLKTGIYYLRRRGRHQAQQFTIEPDKKEIIEEDEICEMCSS